MYEYHVFQVSDISWSVDVQAAMTGAAREAKPVAKIQLHMQSSELSNLSVEMDKHQLWDLYNKLDDIQSQLDSLKLVPSFSFLLQTRYNLYFLF